MHVGRLTSIVLASVVIATSLATPRAAPVYSQWSTPINLGSAVNTASTDAGPALSKDGLSLYFNSNRAGGFGDNDIWVSRRASVDALWSPAQNLGPAVNSSALEAVPALSRDGHWLFFNSNRTGGYGNIDLWASYRADTHDDFAWETPINLGAGVNSPDFEAGASFFENDEGGPPTLFFGSTRPGAFGSFDIYQSALMSDGMFGAASLVAELSSQNNDQRPSVRFDGLEVFLQSDRVDLGSVGGTDVWVSTRETLADTWSVPVNLGSVVNSTATDQQPFIAADRQTLFFASSRSGGFGGLDVYMTTRSKVQGR